MKNVLLLCLLFICANPLKAQDFITKWDLSKPGSGANQISFEVSTVGSVNYTWQQLPTGASGSGSFSGTTCTITGLPTASSIQLNIQPTNFKKIRMNNNADKLRLVDVLQWGSTVWTSMENAFAGCQFLAINATDYPNLTLVTDMSYMFKQAFHFNSPNLCNWNVSQVTNMSHMFENTYFNQPIGNWDMSNVTNMSYMFASSRFNQAIWTWNVSQVTDMSGMFSSNSNFNQPIDYWDVSNVTNMSKMFSNALFFDQALGNWNVSSVTNMSRMFEDTYFNQAIGNWDVSNVTDMSFMFYRAYSFNQPIGNWNVSQVTNMKYMFFDSDYNYSLDNWRPILVTDMTYMFAWSNFNSPIENWTMGSVTNMTAMFCGASTFNQSLANWDVSTVQKMDSMFLGAYQFNNNIGTWDVSQVTSMRYMFSEANNFNQPIGNWNVSQVVNMYFMFDLAASFNQDIGNWDVSNVQDMAFMFHGAYAFNKPIGSWNVSQVLSMDGMFYDAITFNQPIGTWDVSNVYSMGRMFLNATFFNQPLNNWNVGNVQDMQSMFYRATSFNQTLGNWNIQNVMYTRSMFQFASAFNQSLGNWNISHLQDMSSMLDSCGMDCESYSLTLLGWVHTAPPLFGYFQAGGLTYGNDVIMYRDSLMNYKGWIFQGDSLSGTNCLTEFITGVVYMDSNNNGIFDTGDFPIPNKTILANNGVNFYYCLSNVNGIYNMYASDTTNYTISTQPINNFTISEPLTQTYLVPGNQLHVGKNFGFSATQTFSDIEVEILPGPARQGFSNNYAIVQVCNHGTIPIYDSLLLIIPQNFNLVYATPFANLLSAHEVHWNYNLNPFECKTFEIHYQIPTNVSLGSQHNFYTSSFLSSDNNPSNNVDSVKVIVTAAYDPNDKQTVQHDSVAFGLENNLDYIIRFQNIGSDTAFTVVVIDTLDSKFNVSSFEMKASSHFCQTEIINGNVVKWTFESIMLPPKSVNDPASSGYIRFKIKLKDGFTPPIQVQNTAYIYFDFNPAIITNTVTNQFIITSDEEIQQSFVQVYPNPFDQLLYIDLKNVKDASFELFNTQGQQIHQQLIQKSGPLNLDLPSGVYFYKITSDEKVQTGKLMRLE